LFLLFLSLLLLLPLLFFTGVFLLSLKPSPLLRFFGAVLLGYPLALLLLDTTFCLFSGGFFLSLLLEKFLFLLPTLPHISGRGLIFQNLRRLFPL
jgi:hypothetical protein